MDPRIVDVVRKKLDYLEQILVEIDPYLRASYADYARKPAHRRATERLVQIIVEVTGDTSELLLQSAGRPAPGTMRESLKGIRELGIIDDALFDRFNRTYVGLRHRIVHDYETLDNRILFDAAKRLRKDAQAFLRSVHRYLISTGTKKPRAKKSNARS